MMNRRLPHVLLAIATLSIPISAVVPDGFAIYSKGDKTERTIHMVTLQPGWSESQIKGSEQKVCNKGSLGGDVEGQISFDGTMLAFARSLGCSNDDYHHFESFDVYIVPLDGELPATPVRVGRGYWPSWSDDSYNGTKTLYYSTHHDSKTIRAVTVSASGSLSNDHVVHNINVGGYEGFAMMAPNGNFFAARAGGRVHAYHIAGPLAGQTFQLNGGCHPHITAGSEWVVHAKFTAIRMDGTHKYDPIPGLANYGYDDDRSEGAYHFGSSADMQWFVTRTWGNYKVQNTGYALHLFSLNATETSFSVSKQVKLTDDGSWCDVHVWEEPQELGIQYFNAEPPALTAGHETVLSWRTTMATSVTINGDPVSAGGSLTVSPASTTTYTLVASDGGQSVSESVTVTVSAPVLTSIELTPVSESVRFGQTIDFTAQAHDQVGSPIAATLNWSATGGLLSSTTGTQVTFTAGQSAGAHEVTVSSGSVSAGASVVVIDPDAIHLKINCGDNALAVEGWQSDDDMVSGGSDWTNGSAVSVAGVEDAAPDLVYRTVRHGNHSYTIDVPDGDYILRLHFADAYPDRDMTYSVEGTVILDHFDIFTEAGGANKALVKEFDITVGGGDGLLLEAVGNNSDVFECGIEVIAVGESAATINLVESLDGATFSIGDTLLIRWSTAGGAAEGGVVLELSPDAGETWISLTTNAISKTDPRWGAFPLVLESTIEGHPIVSGQAMIRITDYYDPTLSTLSSLFVIQEQATVLSPASQATTRVPALTPVGDRCLVRTPEGGTYTLSGWFLDGRLVLRRRLKGATTTVLPLPTSTGMIILRLANTEHTVLEAVVR